MRHEIPTPIRENTDGVPHIVQRMDYDPSTGYVTIRFFDGIRARQPIELLVHQFDGREPEDEDFDTIAAAAEIWWLQNMPSVNARDQYNPR